MPVKNEGQFRPGERLVNGVSADFIKMMQQMFSAAEADDEIGLAETIVAHSLEASQIAPQAVERALRIVVGVLEFDGMPETTDLVQRAKNNLLTIAARKNVTEGLATQTPPLS